MVAAACSPPLSGSGPLYQVTFQAQNTGTGTITISKCILTLNADTSAACNPVGATIVVANPTATSTPSPTATLTPTPTATWTSTQTATATPTATTTPTLPVCTGDCGGDGTVTIDEILRMINIALGNAVPSECATGVADLDAPVTVDEILTAVYNALHGCAPR